MITAIVVALVAGGFSLVGTLVGSLLSRRQAEAMLLKQAQIAQEAERAKDDRATRRERAEAGLAVLVEVDAFVAKHVGPGNAWEGDPSDLRAIVDPLALRAAHAFGDRALIKQVEQLLVAAASWRIGEGESRAWKQRDVYGMRDALRDDLLRRLADGMGTELAATATEKGTG